MATRTTTATTNPRLVKSHRPKAIANAATTTRTRSAAKLPHSGGLGGLTRRSLTAACVELQTLKRNAFAPRTLPHPARVCQTPTRR
jgi:hypothetical protein